MFVVAPALRGAADRASARLPPMPILRHKTRLATFSGALLFASLLSCGREITGPEGRGGRAGAVLLDPQFASIRLGGTGEVLNIGSVVEFDRVRVVLRRTDGSIAVDTLIPFPPNVESVSLRMSITIDPQAPAAGEPMSLTMKYVNVAGDTVFSGGPVDVVAKPSTSGTPAPVPVDIDYVGVGANAKSITISPTGFTGLRLGATTFTATVLDSGDAPLPLAPIAFTSTDSQRVQVNLRTGATSLVGARGGAKIIAQTLTGQADTADVTITPVATGVVIVSGANQQVRQGTPFPQPVRVRAIAVDNIGVADVIIGFDVTQGQGSVSQSRDTTDANGEAEVIWTAGDSAGLAILRASIFESVIGVNIAGTQLSSAANNLTFGGQPANITAGNALTAFSVVVRDVTGDTVSSYNSAVSLALTGGTAGASLVGTTTVNALNGVAVFTGLTVNRAGAGYRLVASLPALPAVTPVQTNTFNVAAAPPSNLTLVGGGGQSAPASTALSDSIKVRVTDTFGFPVSNVPVNFVVSSGGGSVSPTAVNSDANGFSASRWTLGAAGAQQLSVGVSGVTPVAVSATIPPVGGSPVLFLGVDSIGIALGRTRQVPVFLSFTTDNPLLVTLTMRDSTASWSTPSVVISAGGNQAYPTITGDFVGATWAIATSDAGTDSVRVTVDSAVAVIEGPAGWYVVYGDTVRTVVTIPEPAPPGGLTVTVRSSDSAAVALAPSSGLGMTENICFTCADLRAEPAATGAILAPFAGTAILTIPEGRLSAHLAILSIGEAIVGDGVSQLTVEVPGYTGVGLEILPLEPSITVYPYELTLAPGQQGGFEVYRDWDSRNETLIRLRSLDPGIVAVDSLVVVQRNESYSNEGVYRALTTGIGRIVAEIPGSVADTVQIEVLPGRLQADQPNGDVLPLGTRGYIRANLGYDNLGFFNYGGTPAAAVPITITSRSPGVIRPLLGTMRVQDGDYYQSAELVVVGSGTAWIVLESPGYASDSALYSAGAESILIGSTPPRLGVGLQEQYFYVSRGTPGRLDSALTITLTSDNPSVLGVITPTVTLPASGYGTYARLEGRGVGTAQLTATAPGVSPVSVTYQVFPTAAVLSTYAGATSVFPDSAQRGLGSYLSDGVYTRGPSDTVRAVIRSTNPAVLYVTDSLVRYVPGNSSGIGGVFRAIAPGTGQITISPLSGTPVTPDTTAVITVLPPRLNLTATTLPVGRGLQALTAVARTTANTVPINFTVSVQGPAGVTVLAPADSIPSGSSNRLITVRSGNVLGTDTVIVSAAGMSPDTLFVPVVGTRASIFGATSNIQLGSELNFVDIRLRNVSTQGVQSARDTILVRLVSRDTSKVKVLSDTLRILPGTPASTYATIRGMAPGSAWLVAQHLNGTSIVDSLTVTVLPPRLFISDYGDLVMGMQEQTYSGEYYVQRSVPLPTELWVYLQSSDTTVVTVPDSVLIPENDYWAFFQVVSHDTTGSALVTISAPGHVSSSVAVFVTRSYFEVYPYDNLLPGGRTQVEIWRENANYDSYETRVPIPLKMTVADTTVAKMDPDTATMASDYWLDAEWLRGIASGTTVLTVSDDRVGTFQRTLSGSVGVTVGQRRLWPSEEDQMHVAVGTRTNGYQSFYTDGLADSVWIQLRSVGGKFATDADSILLDGWGSTYYDLIGITEGLDTLVATTPGFAPETLLVRVGKSILTEQSDPPPTIRQGDSVYVSFYLWGPDGDYTQVDGAPMTITVSTTAALQATDGNAPVSTVQIPVGGNVLSFYLKAIAPGGGTVTVTNPNMTTYTINVGTRSP